MKKLLIIATATVAGLTGGLNQAKANIYQDMQVVASFYPKYLHRSPDRGGMRYWKCQLLAGKCLREVEVGFLASEEYYRINGCTPEGFVSGLLTDVLGRPACPQQVARWLTRLHNCGCRVTVAREVLDMAYADAAPVVVTPPPVVVNPQPAVVVPTQRIYQPVVVPVHRPRYHPRNHSRGGIRVQFSLPIRF